MPNRRRCSLTCLVVLVVAFSRPLPQVSGQIVTERPGPASKPAAKPAARDKSSKASLDVQLLVGKEGVGLQAQRWLRVFEKLEIPLTIRPGDIAEKLSITEQTLGNGIRRVQLIGQLDRAGRVVFTDRSFTEAEADKLAEWLIELREFGAQGSPTGKPVWGLSSDQFERLFRSLTPPVREELQGEPLAEAIAAFDLPREFPLNFSDAAAARIEAAGATAKVRHPFKGIANGTALAALLNEWGLGFRPQRSKTGSLQLTIVTLQEANDVWPVGWPLTKKGAETAPVMFKLLPIELDEIELQAVLESVADVAKIPVLMDHHAMQAQRIDPARVKVSHPRRHVSYNTMLKTVTGMTRLQHDIRIDESGRPLIWVSPIKKRLDVAAPPAPSRDE
ncbi:MAG: hypothetical protein HZA46_12900 [Planctomycetales bacterium]|nr:hypothetical protein [Planctomycetales bacterium]